MLQLLASGPSPYARKVRVALAEKGIPFEMTIEVPWDSDTKTKEYGNPLEKLPVLVFPKTGSEQNVNGNSAHARDIVFESSLILESLEVRYPSTPLMPSDPMDGLAVKEIQVVCDGLCDALVLLFFERMRGERQSGEWAARQTRKIHGATAWLADKAEHATNGFLVGGQFSMADIATGCALGYMGVRYADEYDWRSLFPRLAGYYDKIQERQSFKETLPVTQSFKDKVV